VTTVQARYNPRVFDAGSIEHARNIILTPEDGRSTDQRWVKETPHLVDLIAGNIPVGPQSMVLDYGCGVGRLAKELIGRFGCRVIGVDISPMMRGMAAQYVASDRFLACAPEFVETLGVKADVVVAVWVLQHCLMPQQDVARIAGVMKSDSKMFLLNERYRCVPTEQHGWVDDKSDVFALIEQSGSVLETECVLDPDAVGERIARQSVARIYRRNDAKARG
jgi:SAM-dependent methyltransferase